MVAVPSRPSALCARALWFCAVMMAVKVELHGHLQSYLDHVLSWTRSVSEKNKNGLFAEVSGIAGSLMVRSVSLRRFQRCAERLVRPRNRLK